MAKKPIIVLKIGTSTLTQGTDTISIDKVSDISDQISDLRETYDIIIVSSGAIAAARQFNTHYRSQVKSGKAPTNKSSLSAIGQPELMRIYNEAFMAVGLYGAQCLLTHYDFTGRKSRANTKKTILDLLKHDYIPIINENDTVAVEEIELGDNDQLSALVAVLVKATKLIIASDIDGIYTKNPKIHDDARLIKNVKSLEQVKKYVEDIDSDLGTGGMRTKITAFEICTGYNIEVTIVNGSVKLFLDKVLNDKIDRTTYRS
ncbi:MAG: glutamate 5-kinase [Saprospiraceae bacterium]|jgi:glutamate 5-kinase